MREEDRQWYVRAEPSDESRRALADHQRHLQTLLENLRLNPRLTRADDLHWTALFLGSARRWVRTLRALDFAGDITAEDLEKLAGHAREHLGLPVSKTPVESPVVGAPETYDVFFTGGTNAVFVMRFESLKALADALVSRAQQAVTDWEREGKFPAGTTHRLFRHPDFPLAREQHGGKPHVTLARGRVSRERQRDVLRTIRATRLASPQPIAFGHAEVRIAHTRPRSR
ncbi:MAG: hypothetical protein G01um101438_940 [Parcubacteria group bacterium Gr01-1014_38]|nr:MAG: hypothetical protein G01um101438_940 [Parcubacteria group bacterium Gr01-1014_38]